MVQELQHALQAAVSQDRKLAEARLEWEKREAAAKQVCIVFEASAAFYCILQVAERQLGLERELKRELEQVQARLQSAQQGTQVLQIHF